MSDTKIIPPLKPCPFCGAQGDDLFIRDDHGGPPLWVVCGICGAEGSAGDDDVEAEASWNTRPLEDELIKALESVTNCLKVSCLGLPRTHPTSITCRSAQALLARVRGEATNG